MPNDLNRRSFLRMALAASTVAALPSLNIWAKAIPSTADVSKPVKIGYLPITDATPLLVAHANGFYQAEGLTAETPVLFRSWAQIVEAFLAGQVNVVHLLSPTAVWLRYGKKFPAKMVAWNHTNGSALTALPEINSVDDFAGRSVAITFWYSIHNIVLQKLIAKSGLKLDLQKTGPVPKDAVRLTILPPPDMVAALANKSIAGYITAEPFNAAAENLGIGRILRFTGDVWRNHACCVVLLNEADTSTNPAWTQRVVNAVVKAQQWTNSHREETAVLLSKNGANHYTPHTLSTLEPVLNQPAMDRYMQSGAILHPDWHESRIGFQPYPYPSYTTELVRALQQTRLAGDNAFLSQLDPAYVAQDLVDDSFVKTALNQFGGARIFDLDPSLARQEEINA